MQTNQNCALSVFAYQGEKISFKTNNGDIMANATEMAKPFNKRPNDYLALPSTNELITAITRKSGIADNQLVIRIRGGVNPGTWLNEDLALDFAQWLSVDFKLWCNDKIKELLTQGVTTTISNFNPKNFIPLKEHHRLQSETSNLNALVEHWKHQAEHYAEFYERTLQLAELMSQNIMRLACAEDRSLRAKPETQEVKNWYTVVGYASLLGYECGIRQASALGRKASMICKARNISPEEIPDPRFGTIKTYPESILKEIFEM